MKKSIWGIIAIILILATLPLTAQAAPLKKLSWHAEYYDNHSLSGPPKITRFEDSLNHDWGYGSPAPGEISSDYFSVRWTATRHIEKGTYLFLLTVDDGARVWLDGTLIINAWDVGHKEKLQAKVYIEETGDHEIQVAYFENTGRAMIHLEWIQLGGEDEIVGAWLGEYFRNKDLEGEPVLVRQDGAINFDWNSGSPDPKVTRDNFSVRWTRSIYIKGGCYKFTIQHDDGMRVFVDDKNIYDSWFDQQVTYQIRRVCLKQGYRAFKVEYYDHLGNAIARVIMDQDPGDYGRYEPDPDATIVDNNSSGFRWGGPISNRYVAKGGYGSNFYWTHNTHSTPVNSGRWTPTLPDAGNYELFAFIPGGHVATTTNARYRIYHHGERHDRVIDQSLYADEWVTLGTYYFHGDGTEFASLYDNTGESTGSTQIVFDAVKFAKR